MFENAILITDPQNDFFIPGPLGVIGAEQIIAPTNRIIRHGVKNDWLILASRDWHDENSVHFQDWSKHCVKDTLGAEFHKNLLVPSGTIVISKGCGPNNRAGYSAFEKDVMLGIYHDGKIINTLPRPTTGTSKLHLPDYFLIALAMSRDLATALTIARIKNLFNLGLTTDHCVSAGTCDAAKIGSDLGFKTYVCLDACRAVNLKPGDEERAIEDMKKAGAIMTTTDEVMAGKIY
ncbi:MAG TPA: isochorismatase family protein [Candidatus Paceibacterota bacterium]